MGCGSSSLKGEDVPGLNSAAPQPVKKVNTNFASIDYDQDSRGRRMTEYAPHETTKPKKSHDTTATVQDKPSSSGRADGPSNANDAIITDPQDRNAGHEAGRGKAGKDNDMHLKPYRTFSDSDWDDAKDTPAAAHTDHAQRDPTSSLSKDEFATSNDPANPTNQESKHYKSSNSTKLAPSSEVDGDGSGDRKKSWLGQKYASFQSAKQGKGGQISDEELKKYTGRDRNEIKEWAENRPGVAGNQPAGVFGTDNSLAAGQAYAIG